MKKIRKGFTLIEMVIVLFIISLLLLIMIPNLAAQKNRADEKSTEAFKTTLVTATDLYLENNPDKDVTDKGKKANVTTEELKAGGYITNSQVNRAKKIGINEKDNIFDHFKNLESENPS
ncbi:prepilin-type N-terminal cleavage/methylation domain-containing protein [Companilactobacillus zhachilii]|uniref:prepilin-type N-terminal cleavage/methylation domain-containing protein n=1 Tax=Companilactobacillus zhachilii TaxID=2304606 RepID=UPI0019210B4F|nr:prepilin-type N-terminal cleavage/methylation domain-containing protein [Companilactobacillus zhachilii]MBL3530580.1 prepilin-type N-terminal cleavage/methylation domain-containing protein [Companilactobacillus zhachilii]